MSEQDEIPSDPSIEAQRKRRKRKSFIQNARSFGKKGCFGRGADIEPDLYHYFLEILNLLKSEDQQLEDKVTLANNALEDKCDQIDKLASNQVVSRVIELLVPLTNPAIFEGILDAFGKDLRIMSTDKFASHVLQKLLETCLMRQGSESTFERPSLELEHNLGQSFDEDHLERCRKFMKKVSRFLLNNLEDFVSDIYANHVVRTSLLSLAGVKRKSPEEVKKAGGKYKEEFMHFRAAEDWSEIVVEFSDRLQAWPQFPDLPYEELSSGLLQTLCLALKFTNKNKLKSLGKKILHESFLLPAVDNGDEEKNDENGQEFPKVFTTEPSIRLLETVLIVAGPKLLTQLSAMLFYGRLAKLSEHKSANFAVQKLLANVKETEEFEQIFKELSPKIEDLLCIGHTGVVLALADACQRLKSNQGQSVQTLQKTLKCSDKDSKHFFTCTLKLKPKDVCEKDTSGFIHLHGSLIVQAMLGFNKPIRLIQNILETKNDDLVKVFSDPKGSHIVNAFFESRFVGEQSKQKLIRHLDGTYLKLALSKHGSRVLEVMFGAVSSKLKEVIVADLAQNLAQLNGSPFGTIVAKKLHVEVFKRHPKDWEKSFERSAKVVEMFKDITK